MSILAWLLVGIIAGSLARRAPGQGPFGEIGDFAIAIVGAIIGGGVFSSFGNPNPVSVSIASMLVAFIAALILLLITRAIGGRRVA